MTGNIISCLVSRVLLFCAIGSEADFMIQVEFLALWITWANIPDLRGLEPGTGGRQCRFSVCLISFSPRSFDGAQVNDWHLVLGYD